jgi:hypothetical protein
MRRLPLALGFIALAAGLFVPSPSYAQQSINVYVGGFVPLGEDARVRTNGLSDDVLVNNLDFLSFDLGDFNGGTAGAEYLVGIGNWLDAGLGIGLYKRTVPSVYTDLVNDNGSEIEQDLKLRVAPFTATIRFLPLGRSAGLQPYIGAGVGVFAWRYSESGDFVDEGNNIFHDSFVGSGAATGPVILGGVRVPMGVWDLGGEIRYQRATGDLPSDQGFSASKIDLGGWTYAATFNVHF